VARLASVNAYRTTGNLDAVTSGQDRDDFLQVLKGPGIEPALKGDVLLVGDVEVRHHPYGRNRLQRFREHPREGCHLRPVSPLGNGHLETTDHCRWHRRDGDVRHGHPAGIGGDEARLRPESAQ
jgi:hypothetical protein